MGFARAQPILRALPYELFPTSSPPLRMPLVPIYCPGFFSGATSGRRHTIGWGWQAMPMLEQAMTPLSRWQMTQRSVHTAQPAKPDCIEPPVPAVVRGAGPSSSVAVGDDEDAGGGGLGDEVSAGDGASAGDDAAGGGAADGVVTGGCPAGACASAASSANDPPSANARPAITRAQAWVHEQRRIVFLPRPPATAGCPDGRRARQRRKPAQAATSAMTGRPCKRSWQRVTDALNGSARREPRPSGQPAPPSRYLLSSGAKSQGFGG